MNKLVSISFVTLFVGVNAFTLPISSSFIRHNLAFSSVVQSDGSSLSTTTLYMAKGFGKNVPSKKKEAERKDFFDDDEDYDEPANEPAEQSTTIPTPNAGVEALARLRRQQAEQKDEELRAVREMRSVDKYVAEDPNAAVIPEQVAQRMGRRMLPFVGIPLFGVMGTFVLFWYLATYRNMEFQPALVAFSTIGILGVSLLVSLIQRFMVIKEFFVD